LYELAQNAATGSWELVVTDLVSAAAEADETTPRASRGLTGTSGGRCAGS